MRLASACGLDVAEVKIHTMGDKDILMVKRFDRRSSESGWLRSGFISALSLRQQDERDRGWDYRKISDLLSKHSSRSEANRTELFRRVVFNILIRNTDDHARNHGFLFNGPEIQLSPAYDLDPSITGNPGSGFTLTMDFGTAGRIATADNLFSSAARFGLDQSTARDIVDGIWNVAKEWKERFRQDGVSDSDIGKLDASFTNPGAR
jgi:serine/threonine-protein kinase HipA